MRSKTGVIWLDNTIEQADKAGFPTCVIGKIAACFTHA
jgi:hypothetical protein